MRVRGRVGWPIVLGVLLFWVPFSASAGLVAGLQVEVEGELEEALVEELREEMQSIFATSSRFDWAGFRGPRGQLDEATRDCFTEECLRRVGERTGAQVGLRINFAVEAEIYEWTMTFYDLNQGVALMTEVGTCELCGRAEVLRQFRAGVQGSLASIRMDEREDREPVRVDGREIPEGAMRLWISVVPEDTRIFVDEEPVGEGSAEVDLAEGSYEVRFSHDTHRGLRERVIISENSPEAMFLRIHLSKPEGFQDTTLMTRGDGLVDHIEPNRRMLGGVFLGAGGAVVIAGYVVGGLHGRATCPGETPISRCEDLYNTAGLSTGLTVLGGAAVAAGGVLLAWPLLAGSFRNEPEEGQVLQVSPQVSGDYAGVSIFRRF